MTALETTLLRILDLFRWVFTLLKADYNQLRAIVAIKLTMDNRRQIVAYRRKDNKEPGNAFLMALLFYAIFGGFIALVMSNVQSILLSMTLFFSYVMVMTVMTLITDFSSVLLDTSDNTIILPRPVDSRTLFLARTTHILLYLGQLVLGLSIFSCVAIGIRYGVGTLFVFMALIALSVIVAVSVTNLFYLLILQFTSEEKLKNVINYFQIIMAVVVMGGYQLVPRLMGRVDVQTTFDLHWWSIFIPPLWMAAAVESFQARLYDNMHLVLAAAAVLLPMLIFYVVNRYLTPIFSRKLGAMGSGGEPAKVTASTSSWRNTLLEKLSFRITTGPLERGAFELIYRLLGRDRKIKLKIYPAFGYVLVFGIIFTMRSREDLATTWHNLPTTHYHLVLLYLTFMVLQVAIYEIPYSDDFKASWVYFSLPLAKPGDVLTGMLKAIFVRLFVPGYIIISVFVLTVWGYRALSDVVFGFFNNLLMLLLVAMLGKRHLPLSMAPSVRGQSGNLARGIIIMIVIGALGFAHYLLTRFAPMVLVGLIPVQVIVVYWMMRVYRRSTWGDVV